MYKLCFPVYESPPCFVLSLCHSCPIKVNKHTIIVRTGGAFHHTKMITSTARVRCIQCTIIIYMPMALHLMMLDCHQAQLFKLDFFLESYQTTQSIWAQEGTWYFALTGKVKVSSVSKLKNMAERDRGYKDCICRKYNINRSRYKHVTKRHMILVCMGDYINKQFSSSKTKIWFVVHSQCNVYSLQEYLGFNTIRIFRFRKRIRWPVDRLRLLIKNWTALSAWYVDSE